MMKEWAFVDEILKLNFLHLAEEDSSRSVSSSAGATVNFDLRRQSQKVSKNFSRSVRSKVSLTSEIYSARVSIERVSLFCNWTKSA